MKMKRIVVSMLVILLTLVCSVMPIYAWGVATSVLQPNTLNKNRIQDVAMNWNNCSVATNTQWTVAKNGQINYKNTCKNVFKVNEQAYDIVFHYKAIEWQNRQIYHYEDGYVAGGSIPSTIRFKPWTAGAETLPAIEFNGNTSYYSPDVIVDIDIYKSGTTERISGINNIAFAVSDLDHSNDGFFYEGSTLTNVYTNERYEKHILTGKSGNRTYFTDLNPPTKWDMCLDDDPWYTTCYLEASNYGESELSFNTNPNTVILQSDDISNGHFTIGSYMNNKGVTHIAFHGIIFVGSKVEIKYYSDNTSDNLSNYNTTFIGTPGDPVNYDSKAATLAELKSRGFVVVRDDYGNGKNFVEGTRTYEIHVEYRPQQAKTVFIDKTMNNEVLGERAIMHGTPDEAIVDNGYQNSGLVNTQYFLKRGYALVSDEYTTNPKFDDIMGNTQEIKVILEHTYTTVNKNTYDPNSCLNEECTAKQPEKGC